MTEKIKESSLKGPSLLFSYVPLAHFDSFWYYSYKKCALVFYYPLRPGLEGRLVKNCIRAIFYHEFSAKTHLIFIITKDAPSMALLVLHSFGHAEPRKARKKMARFVFFQQHLSKAKTAAQKRKISIHFYWASSIAFPEESAALPSSGIM